MVTLAWHVCKYKIHKLHQRYIFWYLWCSFCTCMHARWVTLDDSGLCCTCITYFEHWLTPLWIVSGWCLASLWVTGSLKLHENSLLHQLLPLCQMDRLLIQMLFFRFMLVVIQSGVFVFQSWNTLTQDKATTCQLKTIFTFCELHGVLMFLLCFVVVDVGSNMILLMKAYQ